MEIQKSRCSQAKSVSLCGGGLELCKLHRHILVGGEILINEGRHVRG